MNDVSFFYFLVLFCLQARVVHFATLSLIVIVSFYVQRLYKKNAKEEFGKFTLVVDRPEIVLAKINAANLSDVCSL